MDQNEWVVHVVHVAVPCGDGAIYLLCKGFVGEKAIVHKAVLIDGGRPMDEGAKALSDAIDRINEKYEFSPTGLFEDPFQAKGAANPRRSLRFDAIVITHWDEDHHLGVQGILAKGYEKSYRTLLAPSVTVTAPLEPLDTFLTRFGTVDCEGNKQPPGVNKKRKASGPAKPPADDDDAVDDSPDPDPGDGKPKGGGGGTPPKTNVPKEKWPKYGAVFLPCWYCKYDMAALKKVPAQGDKPDTLAFDLDDANKRQEVINKVKHTDQAKEFDSLKTTLYVPCSVSKDYAGPFRHGSGDQHRYLRNLGFMTDYQSRNDFACFWYKSAHPPLPLFYPGPPPVSDMMQLQQKSQIGRSKSSQIGHCQ